jgi:hypothetical protein
MQAAKSERGERCPHAVIQASKGRYPMSHEFKVVLDGIDLADDQVAQLDTAVQQAVLQSLATLDVPRGVGVEFPGDTGIHGIIIYNDGLKRVPAGSGDDGDPTKVVDAGI